MSPIEARARREWQRQRESEGVVADSMEVRKALLERFHKGEITLEAAQAEIARLKRSAKASGKITRNQAWLGQSPSEIAELAPKDGVQ